MNEHFLDILGSSIRKEQDAALLRESLSGFAARLDESTAGGNAISTARRAWITLAAAALFASGVAVVAFWPRLHPVRFAIGGTYSAQASNGTLGAWVSAPESTSVPIEFADGSHVTVRPQARMRIARSDTELVSIMVERGGLDFNVAHHEKTRWSIATGPFEVTITGTQFDLKWQPETETLELAVRRGSVVVSGCQFVTGKDIRANEVLRARCNDTLSVTTTERASLDAPFTGSASSVAGLQEPIIKGSGHAALDAESVPLIAATPKWQTLAQKGQYRAAYDIVDHAGFDATCAHASASDLLLLTDVARYSGQPGRAESAAVLLRKRYPGQPQAAIAAFTLGRMAFDQASDFGAAATWFSSYLKEQPGGALAREAEGRLMESLARSGRTEQARQAAERYLAKYPDGPHARLARTLLVSRR